MTNLNFKLTREQFEAKRALALQGGFAIAGDKGEQTQRGVTFKFEFVEADLNLKLTIEKVSFADKVAGWGESHVAAALTKILKA